jgi:O-antigen ligase
MSKAQIFNNILGVLVIVISGILGGFILAGATSVFIILSKSGTKRLYFILTLFLITFLLADNFKGPLAFIQDFRFVILGLSVLILLRHNLFQNNKGTLLISFTIYTLVITFIFSPLGFSAIIRSLGFIVVALVIFKLLNLLLDRDRKKTIDLILSIFFLYIFLNIIVFFFPIYEGIFNEGRFSGLMGNPNGLGLLGAFSYVLIQWIGLNEMTTYSKRSLLIFKVLLFLIIILTGSRTALLAVFAFELILRVYKNKILLIVSLLSLTFIGIILNSVVFEELIMSLGLIDYLRLDTLETASGRTEVWEVAYDEFLRQPWLGKGLLYDDYFIQDYSLKRFGENNARNWNKVWNSYLSLALDVGIIGILLFGHFWYRLFKASTDKIFGLAFIVMILITAVTESWMAASMNTYMPVVFLIWALQTNHGKRLQKTAI